MSQEVAARQIVFHAGYLFMVDAAGQLWVTEVGWEPSWTRIKLPTEPGPASAVES